MKFEDDILITFCYIFVGLKQTIGVLVLIMEKKIFLVLIKLYFLQGKKIAETEEKFKTYGDSVSSHGIVHMWFTKFPCGCMHTTDAEHSGCPVEIMIEEMINKIHDMLEDCLMKVPQIAEKVNISIALVFNTLHAHLDMKKLSLRWISRLLAMDQKQTSVTISKQCSDNSSKFLLRYATSDET